MSDPLQILRKIKSVTFASTEAGEPRARIIDVMLVENDKLYFLTARGKPFYRQLLANPSVAIVGMTPAFLSVRAWGKVGRVDRGWIDRIFQANPMMNDLYPGEKRDILDPFCLYEGEGETFDLSKAPLVRTKFSFGGGTIIPTGFIITDDCQACGDCFYACPVNAIEAGDVFRIVAEHCLDCGRCVDFCSFHAIRPAADLYGTRFD